jgi:hypothetical protein
MWRTGKDISCIFIYRTDFNNGCGGEPSKTIAAVTQRQGDKGLCECG